MMQSLTQTWYLTCGKSRGHTIFFASLKLVGQVFPMKTFLPECHVFVEACLGHFVFYFHLQSHERYFQAGILGIASFIQWSNCIYLKLIQLDFLSGGSSCVITRLVQKQLLKMRVLHPVHRRWSIAVFSDIFHVIMFGIFHMIMFGIFYMMIVSCIVIISGRFFFFSPALGVIAPLPAFVISYCFLATVDDFIIMFITFPPITIH